MAKIKLTPTQETVMNTLSEYNCKISQFYFENHQDDMKIAVVTPSPGRNGFKMAVRKDTLKSLIKKGAIKYINSENGLAKAGYWVRHWYE